jgi:DNA-binding MarR family transcriptional regulator
MTKPQTYLMRALLHAYYWCDESLQNSIRADGYAPLSRTKSTIMVNVSDGITRPADLARNLGISRQAIQQTLAEMEAEGLISLRADPKDGRAKIIEFSRRGRGIGRAAFEAIRAMEQELERRLGRRTMQELRKALYADWGPYLKAPSAPAATARERGGEPKAAGRRGR